MALRAWSGARRVVGGGGRRRGMKREEVSRVTALVDGGEEEVEPQEAKDEAGAGVGVGVVDMEGEAAACCSGRCSI